MSINFGHDIFLLIMQILFLGYYSHISTLADVHEHVQVRLFLFFLTAGILVTLIYLLTTRSKLANNI